MAENDEFPNKVRHLRQLRGWSQAELAERTGKDRHYISRVERGIHRPHYENQLVFLKAFGLAVSRRKEVFPWAS